MQFKQGDKVVFQDEDKAEVQFGPFRGPGGVDSYLVKWLESGPLEGCSSIVRSVDLTPAPKFEAGQVVRTHTTGDLCKVAAGPFRRNGNPLYVLEDPTGNHRVGYEDTMVPVVE